MKLMRMRPEIFFLALVVCVGLLIGLLLIKYSPYYAGKKACMDKCLELEYEAGYGFPVGDVEACFCVNQYNCMGDNISINLSNPVDDVWFEQAFTPGSCSREEALSLIWRK